MPQALIRKPVRSQIHKEVTMILALTKIGLKTTRNQPVSERICRRAETRSLLELDDHLLRDIGLSREQVCAAACGAAPLPTCDTEKE
jgi:uncharacterized protein YjiS (DUF1127 family)